MILSPGIVRAALSDALAASLDGLLPEGTPRRVHGAVRMPGKVTAVLGVRRAGKTTFVHQLRRERLAAGTARALLPYVNFEDERLAGLEGNQLGLLLEEYGRRVPDAARLGTVLWCFDEIQVVPGWERFVRRLLDSKSAEVIVAGSSAALLSREIGTALRGRAWSVIPIQLSRGARAPGRASSCRPRARRQRGTQSPGARLSAMARDRRFSGSARARCRHAPATPTRLRGRGHSARCGRASRCHQHRRASLARATSPGQCRRRFQR